MYRFWNKYLYTCALNFCAIEIYQIKYSIYAQDWLKCRLNVNYVDSPNYIEIDSYPINNLEAIPPKISINFADFRIETAARDTKLNVIALLWTQQNEASEFYIAIDDPILFQNYDSYLNNAVKVCEMAENSECLI